MSIACIVSIIVLIAVLLIGAPIPFAFMGAILSIVIIGDYDYSFLVPYGYTQAGTILLIAIPMFILAGSIMEKSGIGEAIVNFADLFVGRIKGGLCIVMTVACALFGSVSGSGLATLSCIGSIMLPRMYAAGYPRGVASALISSASLLGLLIPPSMNMILFAFVGGQSVLACFLATVLPGIVLIIFLSLTSLFILRKDTNIQLPQRIEKGQRGKHIAKTVWASVPAMLAPIIILGGIYAGIMTPTEAAAVAVLYSIPVGWFVYKGLNRASLKEGFIYAGKTAGSVLTMLFCVMMLSRLYVMEQLPRAIIDGLFSISDNPQILIIFVNIFLIIIGMLMDDTSAILLTTPIMLPVATALGINPIHYAAIMAINLGLGCVTPPTAPFLYFGSRVGGAPINEMLKPTMYYIFMAWIPTLIITTYIPKLALFLPTMFGYI